MSSPPAVLTPKKHVDDVEQQELYWVTESRRSYALETAAGMIAKAKALLAPDVEYSEHYAAIAGSLADDVLAHFSRAA